MIEKLKRLSVDKHNGHYYEVMYKVGLFSKYLASFDNNSDLIWKAINDWWDICDKHSLDFIESIIMLYQDGNLYDDRLVIFDEYREYFERATKFLIGQETWIPMAEGCKNSPRSSNEPNQRTL